MTIKPRTRLNENLWSAHGGVTQKYYLRENGKSLEFMEMLIGIVSGVVIIAIAIKLI